MSQEIDELFGDGGAQAKPRTGRILAVLGIGMLLAVLGMACTAVPGGLIALVAWHLVERELGRVDSGFLPLEYRPALVRVRALVWGCLVLVLLLFAAQFTLLCTGVYFDVWSAAIEALRPLAMPAAAP